MITAEAPTLPTLDVPFPTEGRFVIGGGLLYTAEMLQPLAKCVGELPGVTDVDTITFREAAENPWDLRRMLEDAHFLGHSAMGTAYREARPIRVKSATMVDTVEPQAIGQLLLGAGRLNTNQIIEGLTSQQKKNRHAQLNAVASKARELADHYLPNGFLFRVLPVISRTSTVEALESTRDYSQDAPMRVVFMENGEFGFGDNLVRKLEADESNIQIGTLTGKRMTHERLMTNPDEVLPLLFPRQPSL